MGVNLYQVVFGQQSVRTLFKYFFFQWPPVTMSKNHFLPFQINTIIYIFVNFFTKWLPVAILDVQNSLSMAFLAISDQHKTFLNFVTKWPAAPILDVGSFFGTFFFVDIFDKMAAVGHFGCLTFTFDGISGHFTEFYFFWKSYTIDCISGHFRSIGHFGCLKFTFNCNSGHFRSIQNFRFFFGGHFSCPHFWPFH